MTVVATASWRALGTSVHLLVTADERLAAARVAVERMLDDVDRTYSRFRPDSELSLLNGRPGVDIRVSPLLGQAIAAAVRAARLTDGAVDPTVGRAMRAVGYDDDFARIDDRRGTLNIRLEPVPGWRAFTHDPTSRTVRLRPGVELDLGSTGKALAADLAAQAALGATHARGVLVSLGGDIALAGVAPEDGWRILVDEDSSIPPDSPGEVIALRDGALATSSTTVRRWQQGGVERHHLIDPATGLPVDGPWRTASVLAATCVDANTAATAAIVKGHGAAEWLAGTGLAARLVATDGTIHRLGGWPEPAPVAAPAEVVAA